MTWRNLCFVLAALCTWQAWRDCHRPDAAAPAPTPATARCREPAATPGPDRWAHEVEPADDPGAAARPGDTFTIAGIAVPPWAMWLLPHAGEDLRAYRDRMLPLAQAALAPQRARVARSRDDMTQLLHLDDRQRGELDAAAKDAAGAIEDKLIGAVLAGDFSPATFKPMTGVALARDVLDTIDRANQRFVGSLSAEQRGALAQHPFDFADYVAFSTRWEDALPN